MKKKNIDIRKIIQMLNYLAVKQGGDAMNKMKAYKLVWLADRYHVRQYGRLISNDTYYALPKGPIPTEVKHILDEEKTLSEKDKAIVDESLKIIDLNNYCSILKPNLKVFSASDKEALDKIWSAFGEMSPFELSEFSHKFPEWKRFEAEINDEGKKNSFKVKTSDFFQNVNEPSHLFEDSEELLSLTKEIYQSAAL